MTVQSQIDAAVSTFLAEIDDLAWLDPGDKTSIDDDVVFEIQSNLDALVTTYGAEFSTVWGGERHVPTASEIGHWMFDPYEPSEHRLEIVLTAPSGRLFVSLDVPRRLS